LPVASLLLIATTVMVLQNAHLWRSGLAMVSDPLVLIENDASVTNVDSATLRAELLRLPQVRGVTAIGAPPWVNLSGGFGQASPGSRRAREAGVGATDRRRFFFLGIRHRSRRRAFARPRIWRRSARQRAGSRA